MRFNRACERLTGYSFAEVKDRYLWDLFLIPEEVEPVRQVFEKLRAGDFPLDFENYWLTKDGRQRLIAWSNTALVAEDGTIEYVIGTGLDITERRQADQEIHHLSSFPQLNPESRAGSGHYRSMSSSTIRERSNRWSSWALNPMRGCSCPLTCQRSSTTWSSDSLTLVRREVVIGSAVFAESIYLTPGFGTIRIFADRHH